VRVALDQLSVGHDRVSVAAALGARSGLHALRDAVQKLFIERRQVLKAQSALRQLVALLDEEALTGGRAVQVEIERIRAGAHALRELRLLDSIRSGAIPLSPVEVVMAEQVLGGSADGLAARIGVPLGASHDAVVQAATDQLRYWRQRAEAPLASEEIRDAASILARSCEAILMELATTS
jgi:hypothetical protein